MAQHGRLMVRRSGSTILTPHSGADSARDSFGGWSPDGLHIAFARSTPSDSVVQYQDDDGNWFSYVLWTEHLYVMNADGTNVTQLTNARGGAGFSPDGTKLVFVTTASSIVDGEPMVWPSNWAIFVLNADDSGLKLIASHSVGYGVVAAGPGVGALLGGPVWSPDGTAIAINVDADDFSFTSRGIELISVDGSNSYWVNNTAGASGAPTW